MAFAGLLASSSSALAAGEIEHVFDRAFKAQGECAFATNEATGKLEPGDVAVSETTGDVFVFDRASNSVDRFSATGECITHFKVGSTAKGNARDEGIAVDNTTGGPSSGAIYVVKLGKEKQDSVVKLKTNGTALEQVGEITQAEAGQQLLEIHGLVVDPSGNLWVYQGKGTVGASEAEIDEYNNAAGTNEFISALSAAEGSCPPRPGFGLGPGAEVFYVGRTREKPNGAELPAPCESSASVMVKLTGEGEPVAEDAFHSQLDNEDTSGVAVDPSTGQVYFDNETSVASFSPSGKFVQRFGDSGEGQLQEGTGIDAIANGDVYVVDAGTGEVKIFTEGTLEPRFPGPGIRLADNREWEQVTPTNKLGSQVYPITKEYGLAQAAEDGSAITYTSDAPIVAAPPTNRAPEPTANLSRRGSSSWGTEDIMTPSGDVPGGYAAGSGTQYEAFTPNLSFGLVNLSAHLAVFAKEPLLAPEASENTQYLRNLGTPSSACEPIPSTCYQALVSPLNDPTGIPFGNKLNFTASTPDLRYAVLLGQVPLTAEANELGQTVGLYEWSAASGGLQLISILPPGEKEIPDGEGTSLRLGGPGQGAAASVGGIMRNAISSDGTRVVWSTDEGKGRLFLRDTAKHETIRLDVSHGGSVPKEVISGGSCNENCATAQFQTASTDGSKIFFTDGYALTPDASVETGSEGAEHELERGFGDLYVCEVKEEGGKLACDLKDLTAEVKAANESSQVQGVPGASDDGSYVYFVANGLLAAHAGPGNCERRGGQQRDQEQEGLLPVLTCSLYVAHFTGEGWETRYVATLSTEDINDWLPELEAGALTTITSRVSPNGLHLAFMSNRSLTGYDNVDEVGKKPDEEVFLYNFPDEVLCVSCKPGGPPRGVFDQRVPGPEGLGLLIDRQGLWATKSNGRWLAANVPGWTGRSKVLATYQSRYLSNSGRLFFNSTDQLVEADKNEKADVYEYEPAGQGTCASPNGCVSLMSSGESDRESVFIDASLTGNDVFFLTSDNLVAQDQDSGFDIYDARVCTESSPCFKASPPPAPPCGDEAQCKGGSATRQAEAGAPPSAFPGPGNAGTRQVLTEKVTVVPPKKETRAQKLAKALKKCKKLKKKSKRHACERKARKLYGPKKAKSHKHKGKARR